jgi:hypothetical protein
MLREAAKFHDYNYREYALRRVRDEFRKNAQASSDQIPGLIGEAQRFVRLE